MKTIFITGASSGFGEATARKFSSNGHRLILLARRREKLIDLAHQLGGKNKCHLITADVRDKEEVENALSGLPEEFRSIDVLVNNAGLALGLGPAEDASLKDWEIMVDTNIKGVIYLTKALLPGMIRRGRGQIINIGSVAGSSHISGTPSKLSIVFTLLSTILAVSTFAVLSLVLLTELTV